MRNTKRAVILLTVICLLTLNLTVLAAEAGPYNIILSWAGEETIAVTWHTADAGDDNYVLYGKSRTLTDAKRIDGTLVEVKSGINIGVDVYSAELTGLDSSTTYYYRVADSGIASFTTPEAGADSFSFMYMGDIQVVADAAAEYAAWGALAAQAYQKNPGLAFGILGGDIVESGISAVQWDLFLKNASPVFSQIPLMPTNGNHESNFMSGKPELYLDVFSLPENGPEGFKEEFYSFDYGNAHIAVLNSWVFSGEQKLTDDDISRINAWIENDLHSSDVLWKIVVTHHPVYSLTSDNVATAVKDNWEQLFIDGGVSLVFCGHQHVYNRSYPMNAGRIDYENGITYIMGVSGEKFYSSADETWSERTIYNTANYQIVNIDRNNLTVQTFDGDGNELDYCAISPRTAGAAAMTRAEFVAELYRAAGSPAVGSGALYSDVQTGAWYYNAIMWATESGIVKGYGGGLFGPDDVLKPEHRDLMLYRYDDYIAYHGGQYANG